MVTPRTVVVSAALLLVASTAVTQIAPGSLRLSRSETDVVLSWDAGTPPYSVYRSTDPATVARPDNHLGTTSSEGYNDPLSGLPASLYSYLVRDLVVCTDGSDCDDGDPCNGFEWCDVASNRCTQPPVLPRSLVDRQDDTSDPQLHMTYLLPADGVDQGLDTSGQLEAEVRVAQSWLVGQLQDCLRWDTLGGSLDVTFARLSRTNEEIRADPNWVDQTIALELEGLGLDDPNKLYVVYYGGTNDENNCGGAAAIGGGGPAVLNLVLRVPPGGPLTPCPWFLFVSDASDVVRGPEGVRWAGVALHESFHALGAVPWCAPDHDDLHPGHLATISSDIMAYDGTGYDDYTLDESRTQYYGHNDPGCLDLAHSAAWYGAPVDPDPIPGPVYVDPIFIPCEEEPSTQSVGGGAFATVRFANTSERAVQFYWLDFNGDRRPSELVPAHSDWCCGSTFEYHVFVATDAGTGECLGLYEMVPGDNRILITD